MSPAPSIHPSIRLNGHGQGRPRTHRTWVPTYVFVRTSLYLYFDDIKPKLCYCMLYVWYKTKCVSISVCVNVCWVESHLRFSFLASFRSLLGRKKDLIKSRSYLPIFPAASTIRPLVIKPRKKKESGEERKRKTTTGRAGPKKARNEQRLSRLDSHRSGEILASMTGGPTSCMYVCMFVRVWRPKMTGRWKFFYHFDLGWVHWFEFLMSPFPYHDEFSGPAAATV